jgi:hypothetical protein
MLRLITLCMLSLLVGPTVSWADQRTPTSSDLQAVRAQFVERLSPTEALLLNRVNDIEQRIHEGNPWLQPTILIAIVLAGIGWTLALYQYIGTRRQRVWELLLESLRWFEGGTQRRSIGIALVESKWDHHKEFRSRWASILINQAIYLLTRDKDRHAIHERANLYKIMALLIDRVGREGYVGDLERQLLCETLQTYDPNSGHGLVDLNPNQLARWKKCFCA